MANPLMDSSVDWNRLIWRSEEYNAFTDLIKWQGKYWVCFRSGEGHVKGYGKIRIISSNDLETWNLETTLSSENLDLRDPKFLVDGDNLLVLTFSLRKLPMGGHEIEGSYLWCFSSSQEYEGPVRIMDAAVVWRFIKSQDKFYGTAYYSEKGRNHCILIGSEKWDNEWQHIALLDSPKIPASWHLNEADLLIDPTSKEMMVFIRSDYYNWHKFRSSLKDTIKTWKSYFQDRKERKRNGGSLSFKNYFVTAKAHPPYTEFTHTVHDLYLKAPKCVPFHGGYLCVGRTKAKKKFMKNVSLLWFPSDLNSYKILTHLNTGYDVSYAGLLFNEDKTKLYVSYYSDCAYLENSRLPKKNDIYLACINVSKLNIHSDQKNG